MSDDELIIDVPTQNVLTSVTNELNPVTSVTNELNPVTSVTNELTSVTNELTSVKDNIKNYYLDKLNDIYKIIKDNKIFIIHIISDIIIFYLCLTYIKNKFNDSLLKINLIRNKLDQLRTQYGLDN